MKRTDIKNLKNLTVADLQQQLRITSLELSKAKLAKTAGKLTNLRSVSALKDDVARYKTVLRQLQSKPPEVIEEIKEEVEEAVETVKKTVKKAAKKASK